MIADFNVTLEVKRAMSAAVPIITSNPFINSYGDNRRTPISEDQINTMKINEVQSTQITITSSMESINGEAMVQMMLILFCEAGIVVIAIRYWHSPG